jgi:hypothetical protein
VVNPLEDEMDMDDTEMDVEDVSCRHSGLNCERLNLLVNSDLHASLEDKFHCAFLRR